MRNQALYRQWHILHLINQNRLTGISKGELAKEFAVSKKTIARDVTNLSSCGFPIYEEQDAERENQVFYYFVQSYRLPEYSLTYDDMLHLSLATKLYAEASLIVNENVRHLIRKIDTNLDKSILKFYQDVQRAILSDSTGVLVTDEDNSDNLNLLIKAILNYKKVSFDYFSVQNQKHSHKEVSPLSLKYFNHNFYLAGYYKKIDQVIVFAVNRISNLVVTASPQNEVAFDADLYFNSGFGIYTGDVFQVKLQFFSPVADYIAERIWHPKQTLTHLNDKSLILEMPVNSLSEIKKFVLGFGANVKVLEPGELRKSILQAIIEIASLYKER